MEIFSKKHSIGKTIADLRKEKGWTQAELAEKLQVSDKAVSKWEQDNGAPSIEFLPVLAELFGVSIDYIMTGKTPEKEVVTISKAELCAKKDDISLLDGIEINHKDEQGKSLIDYILQYQSFKVFVKLCEMNTTNIQKFKLLDAIKLAILTNRLDLLIGKQFSVGNSYYPRWTFENEYALLSLLPKEMEPELQGEYKSLCVITEDIIDTIACDERINEKTLDVIFGHQNNRQCVWYHMFPYLIHQSYLKNKTEMLNKLLSIAIQNNEYGYKNIDMKPNGFGQCNFVPNNFFFAAHYDKTKDYGLVRILEKTIKLALEQGDFDLFEKFDKINSDIQSFYGNFKPYIASEYEIRMAKLKADKSVSQDEIIIQSTIHDGLVNIDELVATKNLKIIKTTLAKYPIHPVEKLILWLNNNELRKIFEYMVDKSETARYDDSLNAEYANRIAREVMENDTDGVKKNLYLIYQRSPHINSKFKINGAITTPCSFEDILKYMNEYKQRIIQQCTFDFEKGQVVNELTKEYLESELKKGNTEIVIIKLCVRLEAILRSTYHYEGDFSEMLDKYCSQYGSENKDDGWGYSYRVTNDFVEYLQKLRMCRNSIVHSEKKKDMLTLDEIQYCIDYICNLK